MLSFSQAKPDTGKVKNQKSLSAAEAKSKLNANASKKMSQSMQSKGFKAENTYFGIETSFEQDGKTVTHSVSIQDYTKGNSKAAVGVVTVSNGTNQESYTFSLEKKGDKPTDVEENFVNEKGDVERAHSWYTCLRNKLNSLCGGTVSFDKCWSAYYSWTSFVNCISSIGSAVGCTIGAGPRALACCSCDCSWWCKYVVGCCDR